MRSDHPQMGFDSFSKGFLGPQSAFFLSYQLLEFVQPTNYYPMLTQTSSTTTVGKWTKEEQKVYIQFLINNRDLFASKSVRKSRKVFLNMSNVIKSRTAEQCRTHHQKMLKYKSSIDDILNSYGELISQNIIEHLSGEAQSSERKDSEIQKEFYSMEVIGPNRLRLVINADSIQQY